MLQRPPNKAAFGDLQAELSELRQRCRNPRCRSKLPAPVFNEREAFCARGCYDSFYLHRCRICEERMERSAGNQKLCRKAKCRNAWKTGLGFGRFAAAADTPSSTKLIAETPVKSGLKIGIADDRARPWRVVAAGVPITAGQYHYATVGAAEAVAKADLANAAHWKAAKAGAA